MKPDEKQLVDSFVERMKSVQTLFQEVQTERRHAEKAEALGKRQERRLKIASSVLAALAPEMPPSEAAEQAMDYAETLLKLVEAKDNAETAQLVMASVEKMKP